MVYSYALELLGKLCDISRDAPAGKTLLLMCCRKYSHAIHSPYCTPVIRRHSRWGGCYRQGENTPSHIKVLRDCMEALGMKVLTIYLLSLVYTMSGLLGPKSLQGSLFMDVQNGSNIVWGMQCLLHLGGASPHAIYGSFVSLRASLLGLPLLTSEQLTSEQWLCRKLRRRAGVRLMRSSTTLFFTCGRAMLLVM